MNRARLIPVSGIGTEVEAEQRAASALLAVLSVVRDFSTDLLAPLGASKAARATVETFVEAIYPHNGRKIRPDGVISIAFGSSSWKAFVEVKTGTNPLQPEQLNEYWDLARANDIDHLLTISNELAVSDGHPTVGLKVRSNSKVSVSHLSWARILTSAVRLRDHKGISDPEQAWILNELIRYLQHPKSGALAFDDMGQDWVGVRDGARAGTLTKRTDGVDETCARWDQLLQYIALTLSSEIGSDVTPLLSKSQRDPKTRQSYLVDSLVRSGQLQGVLRVPNTAGDLEVVADLHGQNIVVAVEIGAPQNKGAKGRASWLVSQIKEPPKGLMIEAFAKNARIPHVVSFQAISEDRSAILGDDKREPNKFRLVLRSDMGGARKAVATKSSFIDSVTKAINAFYGGVLQNITPWQPPAPQLTRIPETPVAKEVLEGRGPEPSWS